MHCSDDRNNRECLKHSNRVLPQAELIKNYATQAIFPPCDTPSGKIMNRFIVLGDYCLFGPHITPCGYIRADLQLVTDLGGYIRGGLYSRGYTRAVTVLVHI